MGILCRPARSRCSEPRTYDTLIGDFSRLALFAFGSDDFIAFIVNKRHWSLISLIWYFVLINTFYFEVYLCSVLRI